MLGNELIHHFTTVLLQSGRRLGVADLPDPNSAPHGRWSGDEMARFLRVIGLALDDAFFGFAKSPCPTNSSPFGVELMVLSSTLGDALDRYTRFYDLITDGLALKLSTEGNLAHIDILPADPSKDPDHFLEKWYATRMHGLAQWLIGEEIPLRRVAFMHSRQFPIAAYTGVFCDNVQFDQPHNRISFPQHFLNRRIARDVSDLYLLGTDNYDPERRQHLQRSWATTLKSSLRARLYRMASIPTMEELAHEFGVSGQTLRRGLKSEGTSYRDIKAEARREVVLNNISDTSLTLSQISVLAGFAETNGLVRAIKSWTGLTPSAFRRVAMDSHPTDVHDTPDPREKTDA